MITPQIDDQEYVAAAVPKPKPATQVGPTPPDPTLISPPDGTTFTTETKYGPEGDGIVTGPTESITSTRPDAGTGLRPPDGSIDSPVAPPPTTEHTFEPPTPIAPTIGDPIGPAPTLPSIADERGQPPGGVAPPPPSVWDMAVTPPPTSQPAFTSPIDPAHDLRSTVISGAPSARTTAARGATDAAATLLANTDRQGMQDSLVQQYMKQVAPDERLTKLQGQVDSAANDIAGVDRYKMAQDRFNTFAEDTDPAFQKTLRDIMDREVGAGGFSGRINTSFGDAGLTRERDLRSERSRLLSSALEGSIQDTMNKESALSGLEGQLSGQGLARFKTAADLGSADANANVNLRKDVLGARSAIEGQSAGEDQTEANSSRGERDYQVGQESEAYQRAAAMHQQQIADRREEFDRQMALLGAGEANNPSGEIGALATQINPAIDMATLAQLAESAGRSSGSRSGGGSGPGGIDWGSLLEAMTKSGAKLPKGTPAPSTNPV